MSPEERQLLSSLFDRVRTSAAAPRDADAEALINQSVREQPYAPYLLAQAVIVQEQGMKAAADRIQQLEARVHELEQQGAAHPQAQQSGGFLGGIGSLFGGGQPQPQRGAAPDYGPQGGYTQQQGRGYDDYGRGAPPQQSAGPWGQQQPSGPWNAQPSAPSAGGSFLRGALGTAAGVAGGVMLAEGISSLFSPHLGGTGLGGLGSGLAGLGGNERPVEETVINNNYFGNDGNNQNDDNNDNVINASDDQDDLDNDDDFDNSGDDSYNV
ncbi:DUF2076 domain-containing protein [Rhizobium sp. BK376]|uniref:DUF2076 domain-containing protein n=1 Tax=Rhizobium sp. BK376 TaxID=2512149 RepID=UPI0010508E3C|nr:DUF2076 domain-containing protein [Rhizobium sp. BK376]TCR92108.1 hypothetical protein EV561_102553 [Rhizobium sp. BK376]